MRNPTPSREPPRCVTSTPLGRGWLFYRVSATRMVIVGNYRLSPVNGG
jgi:hypothetical protein